MRSLVRPIRRCASTQAVIPVAAPPPSAVAVQLPLKSKTNNRAFSRLWLGAGLVAGAGIVLYVQDSRAGVHRWLAIPVMHALLDAEQSHEYAVKMLPLLRIRDKGKDSENLAFEWNGIHFDNPIGLSAGFDKHAEAVDSLFDLGFGYVEVGSVTPEPQDGNPKPRVFRLPNTRSVINRYGFNSDGHDQVSTRLQNRIDAFYKSHAHQLPPTFFPLLPPGSDILSAAEAPVDLRTLQTLGVPKSLRKGRVLAVNLGKNKTSTAESIEDYVKGVQQLGRFADILVINISSPNTPGLRSLQKKEALSKLLSSVKEARDQLETKPPLLVKIAPDLSEFELDDIAHCASSAKIDGIIVSNTTIQRPPSAGKDASINESGGLSGPPLKPLALTALSTLYQMTKGQMTLIGCGGISTADDVLDYGKAGATFVQLYTSLGYEGPGLPRKLKDDLAVRLQKEGKSWSQIVGSASRIPTQAEWEQEARERKDRAAQHSRVQFEQGLLDLRQEVEAALKGAPAKVERLIEKAKDSATDARPILIQESGLSNTVAAQGVTAHSTVAPGSEPSSGLLDTAKTGNPTNTAEQKTSKSTAGKGGLFSTWGSRANADSYPKKVV